MSYNYIEEAEKLAETLRQEKMNDLANEIRSSIARSCTGTELAFELKGALLKVNQHLASQQSYLKAQYIAHKIDEALDIATYKDIS